MVPTGCGGGKLPAWKKLGAHVFGFPSGESFTTSLPATMAHAFFRVNWSAAAAVSESGVLPAGKKRKRVAPCLFMAGCVIVGKSLPPVAAVVPRNAGNA